MWFHFDRLYFEYVHCIKTVLTNMKESISLVIEETVHEVKDDA